MNRLPPPTKDPVTRRGALRGLSTAAAAMGLCGLSTLARAGAKPADAAGKRAQREEREAAERVSQHFPFGPVVPARPLPAWRLVTHQGRPIDLARWCQGQLTAIQLVYTRCSAICPIQGALFAQAQKEAAAKGLSAVQFLSLSIDPLSDTPQALASWLRKFDPAAGWLAAAPSVADVVAVRDLLSKGGEAQGDSIDAHPGQVYFVDRKGALVYRSPSLPTSSQIVSILGDLARQ